MDITDKANLYLFGVSDSGKVIKDILHASCRKMEAYVDDNKSVYTCYGRPVLHDASGLSPVIVSTGVNKIRKIIVVLLVVSNPAVLSAIAILLCSIVSPSTMIGEVRVVTAGVIR